MRTLFWFFGIVCFCSALLLSLVGEVLDFDVLFVLTSALIGIVSAAGLARANTRDGVSLAVIFWFFHLLFFSVAPIAQHLTRNWIFDVSLSTAVRANVYILGYLTVFAVAYDVGRRHKRKRIVLRRRAVKIDARRLAVLSLLALSFLGAVIAFRGFSPQISLIANAVGTQYAYVWYVTAADYFLRPAIFFLLPFAIVHFRRTRLHRPFDYFVVSAAAIASLLANLPTASARFYVFATYFGLFVSVYPPIARRRRRYLLLLFAGIFGSALANFVRSAVAPQRGEAQPWSFSLPQIFFSGNFDSYENFVHTIDFVRDDGIVWGHQALGVLLFWIPRSLWHGKPIGTATFIVTTYVARYYPVTNTNMASPPIAEAYINFHVFGIIAIGAVLGYCFAFFDARYRQFIRALNAVMKNRGHALAAQSGFYLVFYPVLIGLSLFFLRGDMLSSVAYSSGFVVAFIAVNVVITKRVRFLRQRLSVRPLARTVQASS